MRISDWSSDVCSSDLALCATFSRRREKGWGGPVLPAAPASARMAGPPAPLAALPGSDGRPRPGQRPACLPTHGPHMNFHEYQAKQLFADYGIAVPAGRVARTTEEAGNGRGHVWTPIHHAQSG